MSTSTTDRIPLQRAVAVVTHESIVVKPSQAQMTGAALEIGIAVGAITLMVLLFDALPLLVLVGLLLLAMILGPIGVLGLVYGVIGTSFVMQRDQQAARWQQGFLGMGIGTHEFVPFGRIRYIEVVSDEDQVLPGGGQQDLIQWEVRLIKDNDRSLTVGTVIAARPLADIGAERANRLASAVAEMSSVEAHLAPVPELETGDLPLGAAPEQRRPRRRFRRLSRPLREAD